MKKIPARALQQLVGLNIINLRKQNNILQKQLAVKIGISTKDLSLIENGYADIPLSVLEKIAVAFKIPADIFLSDGGHANVVQDKFMDKVKLLETIDKDKLAFVFTLLDIFIESRPRQPE